MRLAPFFIRSIPSSALIIPPTPIIGILFFSLLHIYFCVFIAMSVSGFPDRPPSSLCKELDLTLSLDIVVLVAITPSTLCFRILIQILSKSVLLMSGEIFTRNGVYLSCNKFNFVCSNFISLIKYVEIQQEDVTLPDRVQQKNYKRPPRSNFTYVPETI